MREEFVIKMNGLRSMFRLWVALCAVLAICGTSLSFAQQRIVVALASEPNSLDGHEVLVTPHLIILPHVYDKLVEYDQDMNIVPQLATSWSLSEDGRTWTFELRRGHTFHDGTPVDAAAVKASFERLLAQGFFRSWFSMVESIDVVDSHTVAFTTSDLYLFLLQRMTFAGSGIVSPTAVASMTQEEFGMRPVGSGPFVVASWERGSRIVLEKNPSHWAASDSPIDVIEFRIIPDASARSVALETGEVDYVQLVPPLDAVRLAGDPDFQVYSVEQNRIEGLYMNVYRGPFTDIRVRHAVSYAIDRQAIVDAFGQGHAIVADSPLGREVWGYRGQEGFEYSPERSRGLLAEAGYPNGFTATMWLTVGTGTDEYRKAQAIADMLAAVGITLELETLESGPYFDRLVKPPEESELQVIFRSFATWTSEPDYGLNLLYHTSQHAPVGPNRNFYSNPEVDRLLELGPRTVDDAERRGIYERIQELIWDDQPWVYIMFPKTPAVGNRRLVGVHHLASSVTHFRYARVE